MRKIVFVCSGNTCRSPMAAAIYNENPAVPDSLAESAGLSVISNLPANHLAIKAISDQFGISLDDHFAKQLSPGLVSEAVLIVTMTEAQSDLLKSKFPESAGKICSLGKLAGKQVDVADPIGGSELLYRQTAKQIAALIEQSAAKIRKIFAADQGHDINCRL